MAQIGYAIVGVILISGAFSFWQERRIERTLAALQRLLPQQAKLLRDGSVRLLPVDQLVVGDIILLEQGDNIPADCRLVEAFNVKVNTATVTGKSISKARDAAASRQGDLVHSRNILLAGTSMVAGDGKALVYATGSHTEFGQIAHLAQTSRTAVSPLRKELARLSRLIAVLAVTIGAIFFAVGAGIGVPFWRDVIFSIGIIVAMVPEGLLPTLTLSLVLAAQRLAKRKVLIRNLTSVETLGSATVICTDKTGTLTRNRMQVSEVLSMDVDIPLRTSRATTRSCAAQRLLRLHELLSRRSRIEDRQRPRAAWRSDGDRADRDASHSRGRLRRARASRRDPVRQRPDASGRGAGIGRRAEALLQGGSGDGSCHLRLRFHARAGISTRSRTRQAIVRDQEAMAEKGLRVLALPRGTCRPSGPVARLSNSSSSKD